MAVTVGALGLAVSAPAAQQNPDPSFQSNVEYVVVEVRVSASDGTPKRGLTRDMFRVYEDGVEQQIDAFSVVDVPATPPAVAATAARAITAPDVATNERPVADGIAYLIVIDDESIAASRTLATRHLVREIIDRHLGPNDIAAVVTTGKSHVFQDFTADRVRMKAAAEKLFGDSAGSPTIQRMLGIESRSPPSAGPIATPAAGRDQAIAPALRSQQFIARAAAEMSAMDGRTKAILLITEGSPVETVTDAEGATFFNESIGAQRRLNAAVPIYPIDPRGADVARGRIDSGRRRPAADDGERSRRGA